MENNRKELDRVDELLNDTSEERRLKFNFSEVETIKGPEFEDSEPAETAAEEPASSVVPVEPIAKAEPVEEIKAPVNEEPVQQRIRIIDETSTSIVIEQGPDITVDEIAYGTAAVTKKKAKSAAPKGPLKLKPIQIAIIVVAGLLTLWAFTYTIDHTLAANGISPIFCRQTEQFIDGSASYKGLGYKVQFKFDSNGNLTQKVLPSWKDGPNDIVELPEE